MKETDASCICCESKGKRGRGRVRRKGEGPRENWEKLLSVACCRRARVRGSRYSEWYKSTRYRVIGAKLGTKTRFAGKLK